MSNFNNPHEMFMKPKTDQFGTHMVMTNVQQSTKTKYISIDSKYKDDYHDNNTSNLHADMLSNQISSANFNISLPEKISNVKSITMTHAEIPLTYYNISNNLGNNYFKVIDSNNIEKMISLNDGFYNETELQSEINSLLTAQGINLTFTITSVSKTTITGGGVYSVHFDVNSQGIHDNIALNQTRVVTLFSPLIMMSQLHPLP